MNKKAIRLIANEISKDWDGPNGLCWSDKDKEYEKANENDSDPDCVPLDSHNYRPPVPARPQRVNNPW